MEFTHTFDFLKILDKEIIKNDMLAAKENGKWIKYSSQEYVENANILSCALIELGFNPGDKVVTISNNRPEWNFIDMGLSQAGIIHVPIYPTIGAEEYKYIISHAEPKIVIVSDKLLYNKIKPLVDEFNYIHNIYTFNNVEGAKNWKELYELGKKSYQKNIKKVEEIKNSIKPDDTLTIIYTSGTTGFPKGVMLTHNNIISQVKAISEIFNFNHTQRTLSFLPISHIFERTINYYFQSIGLSIYYAENMGTISDNLKEITPDVFITVPRLLEKVYDKIIAKGKDLKGIKRQIFFWAVNLGLKFDFNKKRGPIYNFQLRLANKLVFSKWREALGNKISLIVAGGAALQPRLAKVFNAAQIPVVEGYGLTETSPVIAANRLPETGDIMIGTVGPALPGVEVKIDEDGEILCKGPNIMKGYYKSPELTIEVIDKDGWFHTGDVGKIIDNKYLKITDRKKEIFKLNSGKYIAPQSIENKLKESFFIEQAMVIGENEKFASALISPNFSFLHDWCARYKIHYRDNEELIKIPEVIARFQREVSTINSSLGLYEQIKRFRLVHEEWSPQTGELSPTLKLKRNFIANRYKEVIVDIYTLSKKSSESGIIPKITNGIKNSVNGIKNIRIRIN
ncbi:AMP-dependent synthetase/ligase [Bacteroidota bacterium]